MAEPKAPVMESRTTQNVAGGVAVSAGSAVGAITFARSMFPDLMPWEAGQDQAVAAVAAPPGSLPPKRRWFSPRRRSRTAATRV